MLIQNQPDENNMASAAAERVTTEELTKALAAIEARKEEESRRLEGTILIGQAITELSLDVSAEELLAEIEAQRGVNPPISSPPTVPSHPSKYQQDDRSRPDDGSHLQSADAQGNENVKREEATQHARKTPRKDRLKTFAIAIAVSIFVGRVTIAMVSSYMQTHSGNPAVEYRYQPPFASAYQSGSLFPVNPDAEFYEKLALCAGTDPKYAIVRVRSSLPDDFSHAALPMADETVYPLRAVPDGYRVYEPAANGSAELPELDAAMFSAIVFRPMSSLGGETIEEVCQQYYVETRYDGRAYRCGYIEPDDIPALRRGKPVTIWPSPGLMDGPARTPVTIPETKFVKVVGPGGPLIITPSLNEPRIVAAAEQVRGVQVDAYTFEDAVPAPYTPPAWAQQQGVFLPQETEPHGTEENAVSGLAQFDASSVLARYGQVSEGQVVHCSAYTLGQFVGWSPHPAILDAVWVDTRPKLHNAWTIVKHQGHPYLRAWIPQGLAQQTLARGSVTLYSRKDDALLIGPLIPITVRADELHLTGSWRSGTLRWPVGLRGMDEYYSLEVTNLSLDAHAYETLGSQ